MQQTWSLIRALHRDFQGADLTDADLRFLDLSITDLTDANLTNTDLRNTRGLTHAQRVDFKRRGAIVD